jgi:hypothetical protein
MSVIGPSCALPSENAPGCACATNETVGGKMAGAATALAAAACTACCILPFTLPAALPAIVGGSHRGSRSRPRLGHKTRHCGRRLQLVMDRMAALANRAAGQPCHGRADDCGDGLDGHRSLLAADRAGRFPCAGNRAKETGPSERIGRDARRGDRTDMISRSPNRLESVPTKWPRMRCATSRDGTRIRCSAPCSE